MTRRPTGFDVRPERPFLATGALFVIVIVAAAAFAHWYRESLGWAIEAATGTGSPPAAARTSARLVVFAVVATVVAVAATINHFVEQRWSHRVGVEAVAASARGEDRRISFVATGLRAAATWLVSSGMVSIGRESAIIETGGAVGAVGARRFGGRGDTMAAAGIAAAFAAAYHAPIAAILYVEEHLGVRRSRRALVFVLGGSVCGHLIASKVLGGSVIFPPIQGSYWSVLRLGLLGLVPAALAARVFLEFRVRVTAGTLQRGLGVPRWVVVGGLAAIAGASVAFFPAAAGNGMDALRGASVASGLTVAVALSVGKLAGTTAALGSGAPGGVLTPTISVSAGFALLTMLAAEGLGATIAHPWNGMVAAMAVGLTVGLRSPVGAVFLVPELLGDYGLVPVVAVIVVVAWFLDRVVDRIALRVGERLPTGVHDEDA